MLCKRCPHLVRHGKVASDGQIEFHENCGLKMKADLLEAGFEATKPGARRPAKKADKTPVKLDPKADYKCDQHPFPDVFDYLDCGTYRSTFKGGISKNDVIPTKDFQYSDVLNSGSITDMELL